MYHSSLVLRSGYGDSIIVAGPYGLSDISVTIQNAALPRVKTVPSVRDSVLKLRVLRAAAEIFENRG